MLDWAEDDTAAVLRKLASADTMPGVEDSLFGEPVFFYDARPTSDLPLDTPGKIIVRSGPAIARATKDGVVWIGHVKRAGQKRAIKLPATHVFADEAAGLPESHGYRDVWYEQEEGTGYLHFPFYNGAMGTQDCEKLLTAYRDAFPRPTKALVLMGGPDHWSNGLNLNLIEAADSPADESWRNINAIDDLSEAIIRTTRKIVIAAVRGNAGAGGVFLAHAADEVWLREGTILNPHYKDMGNLYGWELWTYLLPGYAGEQNARRITEAKLPAGAEEALSLRRADGILNVDRGEFYDVVKAEAKSLAAFPPLGHMLEEKAVRKAQVVSQLYRGFEQILHGKAPLDALVYAPRICGIYSASQSVAAARAIAQTMDQTMPVNGQPARWADEKSPASSDFRHFLYLSQALELDRLGRTYGQFMSYGAYRTDGTALFKRGVFSSGTTGFLDTRGIAEDLSYAWYAASDGPQAPFEGETRPDAGREEAYSWCEAPRLAGKVVEVGALARQLVDGHPLIRDLVSASEANVYARVVARLLEIALVINAMSDWIEAIEPGERFILHGTLPEEAQGARLTKAARGSLGHWLKIEKGRLANYQIISPTTWKFSPRDEGGTPGALEQALDGTPVRAGETEPIAVQHVVRPFDPCLVCSVH